MAVTYVDEHGKEHRVRCPLLRAVALLVAYSPACNSPDGSAIVLPEETLCTGKACGSFRMCSGRVAVDKPSSGFRGEFSGGTRVLFERDACQVCGKRVRKFQNGRIARHKDKHGLICQAYRDQRDMGEGTGA